MSSVKPYERLRRHLAVAAPDLETKAYSEDDVRCLEIRYGVSLPVEFREYLLNACSADENVWDDRGTGWWQLERIKNIPDEYKRNIENLEIAKDAASYLFFADYLAWSFAWAIDCGHGDNRGRVAIISGHDNFVADSFGEFVDLYLKDKYLVF